MLQALRKKVVDAATAGTIAIDKDNYVLHVSGTGTVTLGLPRCVGQRLSVVLVAAGSAAITATSAINSAGNTVCTLATVRAAVRYEAVEISGVLTWNLVANQGGTLS